MKASFLEPKPERTDHEGYLTLYAQKIYLQRRNQFQKHSLFVVNYKNTSETKQILSISQNSIAYT